jgi:small neutral amino acid transporter SnatA (MarC family)
VLAGVLSVGGFLVSGLLTLLAVIASVASVTVAVRAIRGGSEREPKIIAAVAIVLAALILLAVLWLIVAFALNPPD